MAAIGESRVSIRIFGDDLDPAEISTLLGHDPSMEYRKGDRISAGRENLRTCGAWILEAEAREPEAIDDQVAALFSSMPASLETWRMLTARYSADVFCGLFMNKTYGGFSLRSDTLEALASRGLEIHFCMYGEADEEPEYRGGDSEV